MEFYSAIKNKIVMLSKSSQTQKVSIFSHVWKLDKKNKI